MGVDSWKKKTEQRKSKVVVFADAILENDWGKYILYRLRFFFLNLLFKQSVHILEVVLLFHIFNKRNFELLIFLFLGLNLISQFWWGALETYRENIRDYKENGKLAFMQFYIKRWVRNSIITSITITILISLFLVIFLKSFSTIMLFYILAAILRFNLDLPMQTYHSGIYAISRVYRPLRSFVIIELGGFLSILSLYPFLKEYSLPLAVIISSILNLIVRYHYASKAYSFNTIKKKEFKYPNFKETYSDLFLPGFTHMLMKIDILILLTVFKSSPEFTFSHKVNEFLLWFLIYPIIQACFDWIRLMYFDLKKINRKVYASVKSFFQPKILRYSFVVSAILFSLALLIIKIVIRKDIGFFWYGIPLFITLRSLLASKQMIYFTEGKYKLLSFTMGIYIAIILTGTHFIYSGISNLCLITISILCYILFIHFHRIEDTTWTNLHGELSALKFINENKKHITQIGTFDFSQNNKDALEKKTSDWANESIWLHSKIIEKINKKYKGDINACLVFPGKCLWVSKNKRLKANEVLKISLGLGQNIDIQNKNIDEKIFKLYPCLKNPNNIKQDPIVISFFKEIFTSETYLDLFDTNYRKLDMNYKEELVLGKLQFYLKFLKYKHRKNKQVDCLLNDNRVRYVFIYNSRSKGKSKWERFISEQNLLRAYYS
jgi:hypothetical protein